MEQTGMKKKQVIIIGGGPAGLTAAHKLLSEDKTYDVTVLEGSNALGGISQTIAHNGCRMDLGGHRFFSKSGEVMDWWISRMPLQGAPSLDDKLLNRPGTLTPGGPDPETEDRVLLVRNRISRIYYHGKFFDYPITMKWQTFRNMGFFTTVQAGFSYLYAAVRKLPETSLENFYVNRFGRKLYSMFFEGYTEKVWGRHPKNISADWGAQRVKGLSVMAVLFDMLKKAFGKKGKSGHVETSLIESFYYPKFGPGQLWELTADEVRRMGGKILMNSRAVGIVREGGRIVGVTVEDADGARRTLQCDDVISSMPLMDLVRAMEDVPEDVRDVSEHLPYRDFTTVGLLLPRLALKNETGIPTLGNIVPDCWIYVQDERVKLGRVQIFNNWSPYLVPNPGEQVWIGLEYFCAEGDDFWNLSDEDCIAFARAELVSIGVIDERTEPLDAHRVRVKKAYPAYFDSYDDIDTLKAYLNTVENLYCVGRNGQHHYNNMDHSMLTAMEAAKNILSGSTGKENVWNVNTEKDYHEEKKAE